MLHRTLLQAGGDHAHGGGHGHGHIAAHTPQKIIERSALYTHGSSLGYLHFHAEPNFRKKPLGMQAYSWANMDIFGQVIPAPFRHVETKIPGMWYGLGHMSMRTWGWMNMKMARKWWCVCLTGSAIPWLTLYKRQYVNGFQQKNRGAVFGMD